VPEELALQERFGKGRAVLCDEEAIASPGAVSYRIYRRTPWSTEWQSSETVGNVTQHVVTGASIDDWVFGVAAIGPGGHESLISVYVPRSRADDPIKFAQ